MPDVDMLHNVPLFAGLADQELLAVGRSLGKRIFGKGVFIFHKDSPGQVLYIIESGRVRIFALSDMGQELSLNIYGPGDVFGELGALDGLPRSASVVAMEMTITLTLQRDDFLRCLEAYPQVASTARRKSSGSLGCQWTAGIRPPERLSHRPVEVIDKGQEAFVQVFKRRETGSFQ